METKIISAFPACGKTFFCKHHSGVLDSDSSRFSWLKDEDGNNTRVRNPAFPDNYIEHIKENIGKVDIIFVSSHKEVRDALERNNLPYTLVYPDISLKEEWIRRLKARGDDEGFINFISENWETFINEMDNEVYPAKIKLIHPNSYWGALQLNGEAEG